MNKSQKRIRPMPLFDTYEAFQTASAAEYSADRPAIVEYIQQFEPDIPAMTDFQHVRAFLKSYSSVKTTFTNYRTQVERLTLWSWIKANKSVTQLRRSDVEAYMDFAVNPDKDWVGTDTVARFLKQGDISEPNERWHPFAMKISKTDRKKASDELTALPEARFSLSRGSVTQVFAICSSFFEFLVQEDVVPGNAFRAVKQKRWSQRDMTVDSGKSLSHLQWEYVLDTAEQLAKENPKKHERSLFIVVTLKAMYLRISDLVGNTLWKPTMGSFRRDNDGAWWYDAVGKGNVKASIAVKPDYLAYLTRYRRSRGLTDLPYSGDTAALLTKLDGRDGLTDRQVRTIVQEVFDAAFQTMKAEGRSEDEISTLRTVTLHWLRHTGATHDAPFRDAKHLQADMRHSSLSTTQDIYYNSLNEERAAGVAKLKVR